MERIPREITTIYNDLAFLPPELKIRFSINHLVRIWYLAQPFYLLNTTEKMDEEDSRHIYYQAVLSSGINSKLVFIQHKLRSTLTKFRESYYVFAWCYDVPDKDSILYYAFDKKGRPDGIYGFNLNRPEHGETFIARSLSDILVWKIKTIRQTIINTNPAIIDLPKAKNKANLQTYDQILDKSHYFISDAECVDDASDYIRVIQSFFLNISENRLHFDEINVNETPDKKRIIQLKVDDRAWTCTIHNRDYIDIGILQLFNNILSDFGITDKIFVLFRDPQWGQEMGIGYMNGKEYNLMKINGYIE